MKKQSLLKAFSNTDAEEVKKLNAASGLSYREVMNKLAENKKRP
ncbi:hypothetical protein [Metabacillus mangrovi]|nr:hypothetical protein [Metabacillus mangrovi]